MTALPPVDLSTFNLFDSTIQQCPWPHYATMRATEPVFRVPGMAIWLITRHDLVLEVVRDVATFSSAFGPTGMPAGSELGNRLKAVREEMGGYAQVSTLLSADPPVHTRFRKLVSKAFSPKAIGELEPFIRQATTELIESWVDRGRIEFVKDFAVPLPVRVIAHALNVPNDRLADFKRWSDDSIAAIGTQITDDDRVSAERGIVEFQRYFAEQLEARRDHPQDDMLTRLLNASIDPHELADDGTPLENRPLSMAEMLSILQQILVAGNETTTKMLAEMVRLLAENPAEWERVRNDANRCRNVVEETLRLSTPTQGMWRVVTRDTELGGTAIPKGARVVVMFSSANRDEAVFGGCPAGVDGFDSDREGLAEHLAFGKGTHFCLGANLSRLEGRVALEELSARLRSISLPEQTITYHPSFMLRGVTSLEVNFERALR